MENKLPDWLINSDIRFEEKAILDEYAANERFVGNRALRIFIVIGTFLASTLAFSTVLAMGFYDSPAAMMIIGLAAIGFGLRIHRQRISDVAETFSLTLIFMGFACIPMALPDWNKFIDLNCLILMTLAAGCFIFSRRQLLSFLSVISFLSLFGLWITSKGEPLLLPGFSLVMLCLMVTLSLQEGKWISSYRKFSIHYLPVTLALTIAQIAVHYLFTVTTAPVLTENQPVKLLYFSIPNIVFCLYVLHSFSREIGIVNVKQKSLLLGVIAVILLLTLYTPTISISLCLAVLNFRNRYYTGLIVSAISLVIAIGLYYYDMHFTLLTKSILLMTSGAVILGGFLFIHQSGKAHE